MKITVVKKAEVKLTTDSRCTWMVEGLPDASRK
jgi:hypothetical protein